MSCCNKNECRVTPQLCVDASIFVPEDECLCFATAILFNSATLEDTFDPFDPENQLSTLAAVPETITYNGNLLFGTDVIATVTLTASNSADLTSIVVSPPVIEGFDVAFAGPTIFFETNDADSCYVSMLFGDGNYTLTPHVDNPPLVFADNAVSPQGPYVYDIRFFGVVIGTFNFSLFQPTATTWSFSDIFIDNLSFYPGDGIDAPVFNNDAVTVTCLNETEVDVPNTQAENIGAAALILNLRANSNVIGPYDGAAGECLKRGIYKLCIAFKPWDIGCGCANWEVREIVEYVLCDEKLKAYWGCSTSKAGQRINGCEDRATLVTGNLEIQSSGNACDVFRNVNDFVLTIRNVFQTFSVVGPFGSTSALVVSSILDAPVPFSPVTLITNNSIVNSVAKLANSKLYVALRYDCFNSEPFCPEPQCLADYKKKDNTVNCCVGSLSPFGKHEKCWEDKCEDKHKEITSVFVNKELTNLQDHLFQNSQMSREIQICLTPECLKQVVCPKKCEEKCEVKCEKKCETNNCATRCAAPKFGAKFGLGCSRCDKPKCDKPKCGGCNKPQNDCGCKKPQQGCKTCKKSKCECDKSTVDSSETTSTITSTTRTSTTRTSTTASSSAPTSTTASSASSWPSTESSAPRTNDSFSTDESNCEKCKKPERECRCSKTRYCGKCKKADCQCNKQRDCATCKTNVFTKQYSYQTHQNTGFKPTSGCATCRK
jgi:hypothetical protein